MAFRRIPAPKEAAPRRFLRNQRCGSGARNGRSRVWWAALSVIQCLLPAAATWTFPGNEALAGSAVGTDSASAQLNLRVVVLPVLRVLDIRPGEEGMLLMRIWTNMPSAMLDGKLYHFSAVGEHVLRMPRPAEHAVYITYDL